MAHASARHVSRYAMLETPVGPLFIGGDGTDVLLIGFASGRRAVEPLPQWQRDDSLYPEARDQMTEYFAGRRTRFDFPMRMIGTPFQRSVWQALLDIPYGQTRAYRDLAEAIGKPGSNQAVGAANGANPLPLAVPCHRVVGADGSLTGYGGGIDVKRKLLAHEHQHA